MLGLCDVSEDGLGVDGVCEGFRNVEIVKGRGLSVEFVEVKGWEGMNLEGLFFEGWNSVRCNVMKGLG